MRAGRRPHLRKGHLRPARRPSSSASPPSRRSRRARRSRSVPPASAWSHVQDDPRQPRCGGLPLGPEARERRPHVLADFHGAARRSGSPVEDAPRRRPRRCEEGDGSRSRRRDVDVPLGVRHPSGDRPECSQQVCRAGHAAPAPDAREHDEPGAGDRQANRERRLGASASQSFEQLDRLGAEANARQLADGADAPPRRSSPSHPDAVPDG